jgi:glycerol-3-phosphate dehydrogenase (NAD(P)+)
MKVSIIGDGGWGTALALVLMRNDHRVTLWGPFPEYIREITQSRENPKFLPGVPLPEGLALTADRDEAVAGIDTAVIAIPTRYFRDVMTSFRGLLGAGIDIVSVAKGFDRETHHRMTQVAEQVLGAGPIAALSGPSHAEEVARGIPTAVAVACSDPARAGRLQHLFSNATFRVYTTDDVTGVELGGGLKNVIAIAAGISDGIGFGDNAKAALMTRGLAEMTRLGTALGAHPSTFSGLSGIGDLIVTCTSHLSRNRNVGERLGRGESLAHILDGMAQVAEGVWNCTTARELARDAGIDVPITDEVHAVVHEGKDPRTAVQDLLARDPRPERD